MCSRIFADHPDQVLETWATSGSGSPTTLQVATDRFALALRTGCSAVAHRGFEAAGDCCSRHGRRGPRAYAATEGRLATRAAVPPRDLDAELLRQRRRKLYYCSAGAGGDLIKFVRETEQADYTPWSAFAERFRVQLEYEEMSPAEASRMSRPAPMASSTRRLRFTSGTVGDGGGGSVRGYPSRRGLGEAVCREAGSGSRPAWASRRKRSRRASRGTSSARGGPDKRAGERLLPPADVPTRRMPAGLIVGFQARKLHEDDPLRGKYVNSPEGELFHKSAILYGLHLARHAISEAGARDRRRGQHRRDRASTGRTRAGRRLHGNGATERHVKELPGLTRRLYLCFDADAAGEAATLRGMESRSRRGSTSASSRFRRARIPPTRPASSKVGWPAPRATSATASASSPAAPIGQTAHERVRVFLEDVGSRLAERQRAQGHANDRLGMTVQARARLAEEGCAGLPQGHGRRRPARARRSPPASPSTKRSPPSCPGGSLRQRASPSPAASRDPRRRRRRGDRSCSSREPDAAASSDADRRADREGASAPPPRAPPSPPSGRGGFEETSELQQHRSRSAQPSRSSRRRSPRKNSPAPCLASNGRGEPGPEHRYHAVGGCRVPR